MKTSVSYSEAKYYSEYDSATILMHLQEEFSMPISGICHEMLMPLYKLCFNTPYSYWNRDVAKQVIHRLENLYLQNSMNIRIDEVAFDFFLWGITLICRYLRLYQI